VGLVFFHKIRPSDRRREHFDKRLDSSGDFFFGNMPRGTAAAKHSVAWLAEAIRLSPFAQSFSDANFKPGSAAQF
jgi:hypothetical protein